MYHEINFTEMNKITKVYQIYQSFDMFLVMNQSGQLRLSKNKMEWFWPDAPLTLVKVHI